MKNANYLIIGAVIIAAFFFLKKKKTVLILPPPPPVDNLFPIDMLEIPQTFSYPKGIYEGMRAVGFDTQYLIQDGKKYGITFEQWQLRGFDPGIIVDQYILDTIPDGGTLNNL
tara:strand:+ start:5316 stop:5654 length:339 start_codon:yes stop_codon:yes gene_type:complete